MNRSVCFLYSDEPHEVHARWANEVEAEFLEVESKGLRSLFSLQLSDYDVVLCEDAFSMRVAAFQKLFFGFKLFRIIADPGYYYQSEGGPTLKGVILGSKMLDGAIAVSEMIKNYAEEFTEAPIEVVNPNLGEEGYFNLDHQEISRVYILYIGRDSEEKNLDKLAEAVKDLDVELHLVGPEADFSAENVISHGYKENIKPFLEKSDLYIQPSKIDAYPISTLEAMSAGVPAIVAENVGTKSIVQKVDSQLVVSPQTSSIRRGVKYFLSLDRDERKEIGRKMKNEVNKRENVDGNSFRRAFNKLLNQG